MKNYDNVINRQIKPFDVIFMINDVIRFNLTVYDVIVQIFMLSFFSRNFSFYNLTLEKFFKRLFKFSKGIEGIVELKGHLLALFNCIAI